MTEFPLCSTIGFYLQLSNHHVGDGYRLARDNGTSERILTDGAKRRACRNAAGRSGGDAMRDRGVKRIEKKKNIADVSTGGSSGPTGSGSATAAVAAAEMNNINGEYVILRSATFD